MGRTRKIKESAPIKLLLGNGTIYEKGKEPKMDGFTYVDSLNSNHKLMSLKFKNNSIDEIQCSHVLQYLDGKDRLEYMDELWRIMKVGAKATCITPYWSSALAIADMLYKWPPIAETSYLIFNKQWRENAGRKFYPVKCNFECPGTYGYNGLDNSLNGRNHEYIEDAVKHQLNSVMDLSVVLTKLE